MKKLLAIVVLGLLWCNHLSANTDELILYCEEKIKTGSEGKHYDKEQSYITGKFRLKLDKNKKSIELNDHSEITYYLLHSNFDLLLFSNMMGHSIRLQKISKSGKNWRFYRSNIMGLGDSIYVSSGTCTNFD